MRKEWLVAAASAAALSMFTAAGAAAPAGSATLMRTDAATSIAEKVARRCWWRNGERRCATVGRRARRDRDYGVYYGRARPEEFRTGSTPWWRAMDEEGRGGHGNLP